jgi:hypothetical protein
MFTFHKHIKSNTVIQFIFTVGNTIRRTKAQNRSFFAMYAVLKVTTNTFYDLRKIFSNRFLRKL